jgi:hypothetical protein
LQEAVIKSESGNAGWIYEFALNVKGADKELLMKKYNELTNKKQGSLIYDTWKRKAQQSFSIPTKIRRNYKISGDLSNIKNWKAKVLLANSGGEEGKWDDVGYVLISLDNNYIVPVARSDEHHIGYELLEHLENSGKINSNNYISVWCRDGNDYIYHEEDIPEYVQAFTRAIQYGVNAEKIIVHYKDIQLPMDKFVKEVSQKIGNTPKTAITGAVGQELLSFLENAANKYNEFVVGLMRDKQIDQTLREIESEFGNIFLKDMIWVNGKLISHDDLMKIWQAIQHGSATNDFNEVGNALLSHNGLKNLIHIALKAGISNEEITNKIFGNRQNGINEFNRLSAI